LFRYGVRINSDFILDLQALPIPIVTGYIGNQPKQEFFPWFYFPLIIPGKQHAIVKNLDAIKTEFVSSIDTVGNDNVTKTILLHSSRYSKLLAAPTRISLNMLRETPDERQFNKSYIPLAVLLEGEFSSVFKARIPTTVSENKEFGYKEKSIATKMIVISDGNIIENKFNMAKKQLFPMGYDKFTRRTYGNKDFIMNCINYLCDDSGLIEARTKEFKIRLLDKQKIEKEKSFWQMINTTGPVALVLALGTLLYFQRKRKYSSK